MRNIWLFIVVLMLHLNSNAQTIVSTNPENRNAIIEEFTGITCGFCPYGHKEIDQFITNHPNDGFAIAYHQGFFAIPDPGQPDYTTVYGDGLGSYFGVSAWPNALINRHEWVVDTFLYPLNDWQQLASQILSEGACSSKIDWRCFDFHSSIW